MTKTTTLIETVYADAPRRVDRQAGIIYGVKILGAVSRNGRIYSDTAMARAATLYEGATVHIDHPDRRQPQAERGLAEGFGELRHVVKKPGGVYGDLHFVKSHHMADQICERAERFPHKLGLSHNAEGILSRQGGRIIVEDIQHVRSVDVVGCPATNQGLFESHQQGAKHMPTTTDDSRLSTVADSQNQLGARLRSILENDSLGLEQAVQTLLELIQSLPQANQRDSTMESHDSQLVQLQEQVRQLRAEHECRDLLEAAGLASDSVRIKALLPLSPADRQALLENWPRPTAATRHPRSSEPLRGSMGQYAPKGGKAFAAAIR